MRHFYLSLLIVFISFFSKANNIYFYDVKLDSAFIESYGVYDELQKLTFCAKVSDSEISVYETADYDTFNPSAMAFGTALGIISENEGFWVKSKYFETSIEQLDNGCELVLLSFVKGRVPLSEYIYTDDPKQVTFVKLSDGFMLFVSEGDNALSFTFPLSKDNIKSWEDLKMLAADKNKIEPYQSTSVRDIRNKKDLTFDDLFYLARASTPLKVLTKYYPATYGKDHIVVKGSYTLYGRPISHFWIDKDYLGNWDVDTFVYFGETNSESAINEANKFIQDMYAYLIKRGRNVKLITESSDYPGCYRIKFNEGDGGSISVTNGGLYEKPNGENDWGVVIHMRYFYK